ncbi:MAG: DUF4846 domain-containing protein [Candidatus Wallbacteria bacterium]|nr:DUF4846 domain-containing protein [Candidatus Wallbacteria bacterium]
MKLFLLLLLIAISVTAGDYTWLSSYRESRTIGVLFSPPFPHLRTNQAQGSFGEWLRSFPVQKKTVTPAMLLRPDVMDHCHSFLDLDYPDLPRQKGIALAVRLWAEYLYARGENWDIEFWFRTGERIDFNLWLSGMRPYFVGDKLKWRDCDFKDSSYDSFRRYMGFFFECASTGFMTVKMRRLRDSEVLQPGDVYFSGEWSGHAVVIMDTAVHRTTGKMIFLLGQGLPPEKQYHLIENVRDQELSPWFAEVNGEVLTPQVVFKREDRYRIYLEK